MSKSEIQVLDFEKICRLCLLEKRSMSAIFSKKKSDKKVPLPVRIMSCASLQLYEGDGLPASICNKCLMSVNQSYAFREQCEQADTTLRQYAQRLTEANEEASTNLSNDVSIKMEDNQTREGELLSSPMKEELEAKEEVSDPLEGNLIIDENDEKDDEEEDDDDDNEEDDDDDDDDDEEEEVENKNQESDQSQDPMDMYPPFSVMETKMEVNEDIDPSRYVVVVENQKKKKRRGKEKLKKDMRSKRKDSNDQSERKKRQRKQDNPKKKGKKNFTCDICREELGNEEELESHRRMRHINEKSEFFCDFCLKIFKTKAILKGHRYKHITDPQFLCVRCGKKYFTISNLNEHSLYCLDEKKFECPVCNKKFNVNKQFKRHLVIHEADRYIKCTVCEQTFSRKDNYRQHFRRHTGEKPYTCDICGKSFRIKATYNYHRRTHRDVRPSEVETVKTEINPVETDFSTFRPPRKDDDFFRNRPESEFPLRIPRRDASENDFSSFRRDAASEFEAKSEPVPDVDFSATDFRKNEKRDGTDFGARLNVDYNMATGGDFVPRRSHPDYYRKDDFNRRDVPIHPEYGGRRTELISVDFQPRPTVPGFLPRRESPTDSEYSSYSTPTIRDAQE